MRYGRDALGRRVKLPSRFGSQAEARAWAQAKYAVKPEGPRLPGPASALGMTGTEMMAKAIDDALARIHPNGPPDDASEDAALRNRVRYL